MGWGITLTETNAMVNGSGEMLIEEDGSHTVRIGSSLLLQ